MLVGKQRYGNNAFCVLPSDLDPAEWWAYESGRILFSLDHPYMIRYDDDGQREEKNALKNRLCSLFGEFANDNKICLQCWSDSDHSWWALSFYDGDLTFEKNARIVPRTMKTGRVIEGFRVRHRRPVISER